MSKILIDPLINFNGKINTASNFEKYSKSHEKKKMSPQLLAGKNRYHKVEMCVCVCVCVYIYTHILGTQSWV